MQGTGATVLIATHPRNERAVLLHWTLATGYWGLPLGPAGPEPPATLPGRPAALLFDENWFCDVLAVTRAARARGVAPILFLGPGPGWAADEIVATQCADFIRRPYEPDDAFARIRRALSLPLAYGCEDSPQSRDHLQVGELSICSTTREASFRGRRVTLRRAECNVLVRLAKAFPRPVSRTEIVEDVLRAHGDGATARNQIYEIRRKLAKIGAAPMLETLRGSGAYQIKLLRWSTVVPVRSDDRDGDHPIEAHSGRRSRGAL
jgi:DNA-binding response OmpR family regulator